MMILRHTVLLIILLLPAQSFASVELCYRKAQIIQGIVDHFWIRTNKVSAGMGPGDLKENELVGDTRADAPLTPVFVVDHSKDTAQRCIEIESADEECINRELEIGKPLGKFHPFNTCYTFAISTLEKCGAEDRIFQIINTYNFEK